MLLKYQRQLYIKFFSRKKQTCQYCIANWFIAKSDRASKIVLEFNAIFQSFKPSMHVTNGIYYFCSKHVGAVLQNNLPSALMQAAELFWKILYGLVIFQLYVAMSHKWKQAINQQGIQTCWHVHTECWPSRHSPRDILLISCHRR